MSKTGIVLILLVLIVGGCILRRMFRIAPYEIASKSFLLQGKPKDAVRVMERYKPDFWEKWFIK